jgi:hypothetical protein
MRQYPKWVVLVAFGLSSSGALSGEPVEPAQTSAPPETESTIRPPQPEGVPSLQISNDFVSPQLAFGDYRPIGEVQSRGIRVAPFTIRAAAQTALGFNDNVALSQNSRISSMFLSLSPSVAVGLEGALHRYYLVYRGNYGNYTSSSIDNFADHNIALSASDDWTTRFRTSFLYDYGRGHIPRGTTGDVTSDPVRYDTQTVRGTASYGAPGAQGRADGSVTYTQLRYVTARELTAIRDYDQLELGGTFYYRVAPRTRAVLQVTHADITHPNDATFDSTENRYLVGVTWEALTKTEGTVRVGYMTKTFDNPALGDFSGPTYEAVIRWSPRTYSVVEAAARRVFGESVSTGSTFVVANRATLSWSHAWSERLQSTVGYTYGKLDQHGLERTDTYQNFALKGSYALQRSLRLGAEYRRDSRDSNLDGFNYRRNLTLVTLETAI